MGYKNIIMSEKEKIQIIIELWIKWNKKQITGDKLALEFGKQFKRECMKAWEENHTKKRKCKFCGKPLTEKQLSFCSRECLHAWNKRN